MLSCPKKKNFFESPNNFFDKISTSMNFEKGVLNNDLRVCLSLLLYSETCVNQTLNRTESGVNQALNYITM